MPVPGQIPSQTELDAPLYRRATTDRQLIEGECAVGIRAIRRFLYLDEVNAHYFLANFEYTLKYKENNLATADVALARQNNITYSLLILLEKLHECPQVLTQPVAWHLKRVLQATLITDVPDDITTRLKKTAKPFYPKILSLVPDPDHSSHCTLCGPIPQLERKLALRDQREHRQAHSP